MRLWLKPSLAGMFGAWSWFGRRPWRLRQHQHATPCQRGNLRQRVTERVARQLRLDAGQQARLALLLDRIDEQRRALAAGDWRDEVQALVQEDSFDRWLAEDLLNSRIQALRQHGPAVIAAMADLHDALDDRQRQQVRAAVARWMRRG